MMLWNRFTAHAVGWRLVDVQPSREFHWGDWCLCHLGSHIKSKRLLMEEIRRSAVDVSIKFPMIYWFTGFYTSQVVQDFFHQQYEGVGCFIQIANFETGFPHVLRIWFTTTPLFDGFLSGNWLSSMTLIFREAGVWQLVASKFSASLVVYWPSFVEHLGTATFFIVHNCHMTFQTRYGDDMRSRSHPCFRCHGPWTVFKTTKPS